MVSSSVSIFKRLWSGWRFGVQRGLRMNEFEPFASLQSILICYEIRKMKEEKYEWDHLGGNLRYYFTHQIWHRPCFRSMDKKFIGAKTQTRESHKWFIICSGISVLGVTFTPPVCYFALHNHNKNIHYNDQNQLKIYNDVILVFENSIHYYRVFESKQKIIFSFAFH